MADPMPTVTFDGQVYKMKSRKVEIPNLSEMPRIEALIWLNRNTRARGYSKVTNPLAGFGGAITVSPR